MKTACALVFALAVAASAAARAEAPPPPAVTVAGEGSVSAAPDIAIVTIGVVTQGPTAAAALKANAAAMSKALAALKEARVEDRDVATSGLAVQPQYDYPRDGSTARAQRISGYEARNAVTLRARDIGRLGELIDRLVQAGSNQIDGLAFDFADRAAKLDDARRAAVADARRKAELYATSAGATLGPVLSIDETMEDGGPPQPFARRMKAADTAATPLASGEQELKARVTMRFGLKP
jgi:uncharacterized protein YggE